MVKKKAKSVDVEPERHIRCRLEYGDHVGNPYKICPLTQWKCDCCDVCRTVETCPMNSAYKVKS